jgi:hypothetical protein
MDSQFNLDHPLVYVGSEICKISEKSCFGTFPSQKNQPKQSLDLFEIDSHLLFFHYTDIGRGGIGSATAEQ